MQGEILLSAAPHLTISAVTPLPSNVKEQLLKTITADIFSTLSQYFVLQSLNKEILAFNTITTAENGEDCSSLGQRPSAL